MCEFWLVFIFECKLDYKELEDFLQPRNLQDDHIDQLSKIMLKCLNMKPKWCQMLCIPENIEYITDSTLTSRINTCWVKNLQILKVQVTQFATVINI
jgi:hypothetical protein